MGTGFLTGMRDPTIQPSQATTVITSSHSSKCNQSYHCRKSYWKDAPADEKTSLSGWLPGVLGPKAGSRGSGAGGACMSLAHYRNNHLKIDNMVFNWVCYYYCYYAGTLLDLYLAYRSILKSCPYPILPYSTLVSHQTKISVATASFYTIIRSINLVSAIRSYISLFLTR